MVVSYRNDTAALTFLQHVASILRDDLIEKIKKCPIQGNSLTKYSTGSNNTIFLIT